MARKRWKTRGLLCVTARDSDTPNLLGWGGSPNTEFLSMRRSNLDQIRLMRRHIRPRGAMPFRNAVVRPWLRLEVSLGRCRHLRVLFQTDQLLRHALTVSDTVPNH